jgi:hypothetical protein
MEHTMSFGPHGGFIVTATDNNVTRCGGIRKTTLDKIIELLAHDAPKVKMIGDIKAIYVFTPATREQE